MCIKNLCNLIMNLTMCITKYDALNMTGKYAQHHPPTVEAFRYIMFVEIFIAKSFILNNRQIRINWMSTSESSVIQQIMHEAAFIVYCS